MQTSKQVPSGQPHAYEPLSPVEEVESVAAETTLVAGGALRVLEIIGAVFVGLLLCPPLLILAVVVVVPLVLMTLVVALVAAVIAAPYFLIRHLRGHRSPHVAVFAQRLRHAWHAIVELLPHHVHRAARETSHA
jgi:hypothetical protein